MEVTMLICPAEWLLYVLYWLQKLFFIYLFIYFLGLQRCPVESYVVELRVEANLHSCSIKISFQR